MSNLFCYFAHHKCASSWINRFFWKATLQLGRRFRSFHSDEQAGGDIGKACREQKLEFVTIRNARSEHISQVQPWRGLHLIRDPRDVIVSGYFSHLKTHPLISPEMEEEREALQKVDKEEGIILAMDGITGTTLREMQNWPYGEDDSILEVKLEDISGRSEAFMKQLVEWSGMEFGPNSLPFSDVAKLINRVCRIAGGHPVMRRATSVLSEVEMAGLLKQLSFENLSGGRKQGETNENSHYRKGQHGDWVNHFTPKIKAAFKARFPDIVEDLGYDPGISW